MGKIKFDYSNAKDFIRDHEIDMIEKQVSDAKEYLLSRKGPGNDFLGWIDLPVDYDKEEFVRIKKAADKIKSDSDVLVVIGIGGSYLGSRAVIEGLSNNFNNKLDICKTADRRDRRQRFLCKCYLQIRNDDRTRNCIPYLQKTSQRQIRKRRSKQAHLRYHRQGKGGIEDTCHRRGIRDLRCAG